MLDCLASFKYFNYYRNMETKIVITALAALAHDSRLAVFRALVQAGPDGLAAGRIGELTGIAPSSLSFHLKELSHAGMVTAQPEGRFIIYSANFSTMNGLLAFLTENCCGGNPCTPVRTPACTPVCTPTEKE
jgi:ArsR family transcriptional regulator, arsenate/arsenite/antimonite-responsive transcriptional repressor